MDAGTAAPAAGPSVFALPPATNRRRKWSRFPRFWRRSPPPAYPKHRAPGRRCFVRRLFRRFTRRFTKKRRHISTDTAISAFYSSHIREIDGPVLNPHEEEDGPAASAPIAGHSRGERPTVAQHDTSQAHASHAIRRNKSLPPTPGATRQRVTWRDSAQRASGALRATSSAAQAAMGASFAEGAHPARSSSARQRRSSAPTPQRITNAPVPRAPATNAHSRHNSMPVPQRPSSPHPLDAPPRPSSASPRPSSASPQSSPQPSLRRSSGRILRERTSQTPAVVREGSSPEPLVVQNRERRSSRVSPPPNASGPSRAPNGAYQPSNYVLHVAEAQPGPSTSTVNRSDPTAMFSTPPPGSTGPTTPEQPQNASASRFVPAHASTARAREELEVLQEHVEEHGRAPEPRSSARAQQRSRRSHATTHATTFVQEPEMLPGGYQREVGDEGEEIVEEGDEEGAEDEWTDADENPRVPTTTSRTAQAQATRRAASPPRMQPPPPQPAPRVEEPVLRRPQLLNLEAMEIVESPRSSILMTHYPRSPLLDTVLAPPEFKLSEVPAGTQNVLRETEHRVRALDGGENLQVIAAQVHAARQVLTKYRHITVVVDTEAKRRHTTAWMDGVQSMKRTCEEVLQRLRDPSNANDDDWLGRRRTRLARYVTRIMKATKDVIADKRREYDVLINEYHERKNFVAANIREMKVDYDALKEMRHRCGIEAARCYVRQG